MRQKLTTLLPLMSMLLRQLRRMMITLQSQPIHMHLPLHLHRLPPKHCLLTLAMVLSPYPLLALQPKNVIYR
jgi:hypothetical protein